MLVGSARVAKLSKISRLTPDMSFAWTFSFSLRSQRISSADERPSDRIDISYLYYLPFCSVFTSKDGLHGRIAPLLITERQCFVHGDDLKRDLARLNVHYEGLPEAEKQKARCTTRAILARRRIFSEQTLGPNQHRLADTRRQSD